MIKLVVLLWIIAVFALVSCNSNNSKCVVDIPAHGLVYSIDTSDYNGHCILMIKAGHQGSFAAIHSPDCNKCGGTK